MHRQGKTGFLVPLKVLRVVPLSALRWYHLQRYNGTASALSAAASYSHIMYDKYRDIYYRFAEMPCELGPNEYVYNDAKAREFSVIIFDKDFRIIGETKFPGNKYFYKMSFIGRDGLYISENNEANPEFDENKLVFACFGLQELEN